MESCSFRFNGKDCHISYENVGDDRIYVDMLYVDAYFYDDCEIFFTPKEKTFTTTKEGEEKGFSTEKHKSKGYNHLLGTTLPKTPRRFR